MRRLIGLLLLAAAMPAAAGLENVADHGFTVSHTADTNAAPNAVYGAMKSVGQWWNEAHSWSGEASNLYLQTGPGGCFCEKMPGGGHVEHLRLIFDAPGRELRFEGALGPLQAMPVFGRMIWRIEALDTGARIHFIYHVTGRPEGGLQGIAPAVDGVIGEQLNRLRDLLATD